METIIKRLNPILKGWFNYFKYSHPTTFDHLDRQIRRRLRRILCKRQKRRTNGRGRAHQKWPNVYFANLGLFSLKKAHEMACQSA